MDLKDLATYGGLFIGFIGIILSIYLYIKGKERKEPRCYYITNRDIEKLSSIGDSDIKIFYKSNEVDRVFSTYVWLWNKGRKAINQSDIPPQSSVVIKLTDKIHSPKILDYRILNTSRNEINLKVLPLGENELIITFDFLDYNDGGVIEIQHTGSYKTEIETEGIILGVPDGIEVINRKSSKSLSVYIGKFLNSLPIESNLPPTRRFVHKNWRKRIINYLPIFIIIVMTLVMDFVLIYNINTSLSRDLTKQKLQEIVTREFPQIPNQNLQNLMAKVTMKTPSEMIQMYIFISFFNLFLFLEILIVIQLTVYPIPKSLYFKDDIDKGQSN